MITHQQPLYPQPFSDMADGVKRRKEILFKTVEVRAWDKKYEDIEKDDEMWLREYDPKTKEYTGREIIGDVIFVKKYMGKGKDIQSKFEYTVEKMATEIGLEAICPGCRSNEELISLLGGIPNYPERIAKDGVLAIGLEDITVLE